ncbi:MAG: L,D-transpeptidase [Actinomycetota bacterium]
MTASAVGTVTMIITAYLGGAFAATSAVRVAVLPDRGIAATANGNAPNAAPSCAKDAVVATVATARIDARVSPDPSSRVVGRFARTNVLGSPQTFLVQRSVTGTDGETWHQVLLPIRPNETTGYVPQKRVHVNVTPYRLLLQRDQFRLRFYSRCKLLDSFKVGIGTGETPTPLGHFFLASLLRLPDPDTIYGTYAYGLSGYSEVLRNWELGGIIGLHGTNAPSTVGRRSSHGCIRMYNRDIERLVRVLPLGTPITIVRSGGSVADSFAA